MLLCYGIICRAVFGKEGRAPPVLGSLIVFIPFAVPCAIQRDRTFAANHAHYSRQSTQADDSVFLEQDYRLCPVATGSWTCELGVNSVQVIRFQASQARAPPCPAGRRVTAFAQAAINFAVGGGDGRGE
ncbi:hypothetical protein QCA50_009096 [Cerrena zonata]|uniref:Uncharacterized protein n=1 Tax=Cerrena zonata TaxID=2478898 RepID=A0AAW0G658_9APHY